MSMKKSIGLSLVAATLLAGSVMAEDSGKLSGDIRAFYFSTSTGYGSNTALDGAGSALSAGFNALYESPKMMEGKLSYGLGFGMQSNIMESGMEPTQSIAADQALEESAVMPNQLYVAYDSPIGTIKAGKQTLDTPAAGVDDYRLMPNTFDAVVLINQSVENLTLIGAQVATISGWDNYGSNGTAGYNSMTDAAFSAFGFTNVEANGATVIGAAYGMGPVNVQAWTYNILNTTDVTHPVNGLMEVSPVQLNYVDAGYALEAGSIKLDLGAQYKSFSAKIEDGDGAQADIELGHSVTGFKAELGFNFGLSLLVAMNSFDGDHAMINAWGGYPEYAIADEYWMNSFDNVSFSATKTGAMYEVGEFSVGGYLTAYVGSDKVADGTDETAAITDLYLGYGDFSLVSETQSVTKNGTTPDPDDVTVMKVQYTATF